MPTPWEQYAKQIGYQNMPSPSAVSPFATMGVNPMYNQSQQDYQQDVRRRTEKRQDDARRVAEALAQANPGQEIPHSLTEMRPVLVTSLARTFPQMSADQLNQLSDQQLLGLAALAGQQGWTVNGPPPAQPQPPVAPPPPVTAANAPDAVATGGPQVPGMTKDQPKGPPPQPAYNPLTGDRTGKPLPTYDVLSGDKDGSATSPVVQTGADATDAMTEGGIVLPGQMTKAPQPLRYDPLSSANAGTPGGPPKTGQEAGNTITDENIGTWKEMFPQTDLKIAQYQTQVFLSDPATQNAEPGTQLAEKAQEAKEDLEAIDMLLFQLYQVTPKDREYDWLPKDQGDQPWYKDAWNTGKDAVGSFIGLYDEPFKIIGRRLGALHLLINSKTPGPLQTLVQPGGPGLGAGPAKLLDVITESMGGPEAVQKAYDEGGLVGLWENGVAATPNREGWGPWTSLLFHAVTDIPMDPTTWIGGASVATKGVPVVGKAMEGANIAANLPGDAMVTALKLTGRGASKLPGISHALQLSDDAVRGIDREALSDLQSVIDNPPEGTISIGGVPVETADLGAFREAHLAPKAGPAVPDVLPTPERAPVRMVATKADPLADLVGMDDVLPTPTAAVAKTGDDVVRTVDDVLPRPDPVMPTELNPVIGAGADDWAKLLSDGDNRIYDWLVSDRRLSDRLHRSALKIAKESPAVWNEYVERAKVIFRDAHAAHDAVDAVRYPKGEFYKKVAERAVPLHRALIQQMEVTRSLGLPADTPSILRDLPKWGTKATANAASNKAIENAGPALLERLVYGTDADVKAAVDWIAAANHRNVKAFADDAWNRSFLDQAKGLRDEYRAIVKGTKRSPEALGYIAQDYVEDAKSIYNRYADYVNRGKNAAFQIDRDAIDVTRKEGDSLAATWFNRGAVDEAQYQWLNGQVDLAKSLKRVLGQKDGSVPGISKAEKQIQRMLDEGITNPTRADVIERVMALDLQPAEFNKLTQQIMGITSGKPTWWGKLGTLARQGYMYNAPRAVFNTTQDWVTDAFTHAVDGTGSARAYQNALGQETLADSLPGAGRMISGVRKATGRAVNEQPTMRTEQEFAAKLGLVVPDQVSGTHGAHFSDREHELLDSKRTVWSQGGENVGRKVGGETGATIGKRLGQVIAPDVVLKTRSGMDDVKRLGSWFGFLHDNLPVARDDFFDYLDEVAPKMGLTPEEARGLFTEFNGQFSPDDVKRVLRPYNKPGRDLAEHLSREWRARLGQLNKGGVEQGNRLLFTYRQTRADKAIGSIYLFHYWMSRASVLHGRLALEHPWLLANYYRVWEDSKKVTEDNPQYPAWADHFIGLNIGPYGAMGFVSPAALLTGLATVLDLNNMDFEDPSIQDVLKVLPLNPILTAASSVYLNDKTPDLLGQGPNQQFAKAATNFLRNAGIPGIPPGYTPDFLAEGTYALQSLARQFAPGADPLQFPTPTQRDQVQVWQYASAILDERGELTDAEGVPTEYANQVAANISAGLYTGEVEQEALHQWSSDLMAGQAFRQVLPVQGQVKDTALTNAQLAQEGRQGVHGIDLSETPPASLDAFLHPEPTLDQQQADYSQDMAYAGSPEATKLLGDYQRYQGIGTDQIREIWTNYNTLVYSPEELQSTGAGVQIGGQQVGWSTWISMGESARRVLMDQWVEEIGATDELAAFKTERDEFEQAHPQVAEFKEWQKTVGDDPQAALETLKDSPGFMAWWNEQQNQSDALLMTPAAFLAASGHRPGLYDSEAITGNASKPGSANLITDLGSTESGGSSGSGGGSSQSFEKMTTAQKIERVNLRIAEYQQKLAAFDAQIAQFTGGIPYEGLSPLNRQMVDVDLKRRGIKQPSPPDVVQAYLDWAQYQPGDADVSVASYVSWYEAASAGQLAA